MNSTRRHGETLTRGFILAALVLCLCAPLRGGVPDQATRWDTAKLRPEATLRLDKAVALYLRTEPRYRAVEKLRRDGVPAAVIFCLHYRESSNSFADHLHEGSPLTHRTIYVPRGRIPGIPPPYSWEQSAEDAIYVCDRLQGDWHGLAMSLDRIERYNGIGYRSRGVDSPYLWSGTSLYARGKFTGDGRFSSMAVDAQLGCAAILKRMRERGFALPFVK